MSNVQQGNVRPVVQEREPTTEFVSAVLAVLAVLAVCLLCLLCLLCEVTDSCGRSIF